MSMSAPKKRIPWNKGKIGVYSEETRKKISESKKGQMPWITGRHHTEDAKLKMSQAKIDYIKKHPDYIDKLREIGSKCNARYWLGKKRSEISGEKHRRFRVIPKDFLLGEYVENKKSITKIAKEKRASTAVVSRWLKRYGISLRNFSELAKSNWGNPIVREKMMAKIPWHRGKKIDLNKYPNWGSNGKHFSEETREKMSLRKLRYGTPVLAASRRMSKFQWKKIRNLVLSRDNYQCQKCNNKPRIRVLHTHHRIPWNISKDNSLENLITLCWSCHTKEDYNYIRQHPEQFHLSQMIDHPSK